jgi:DNA-binding IscR family transcriptional regulator
MCLIAADFARPDHGWTHESLASMLRVPRSALDPVMAALHESRLIVSSVEERLLPGRDPHHIQLTDILDSVRGRGLEWSQTRHSWNESVDAIADRIDRAIEAELGGKTLGQLIDDTLAAESE